jgi:hypothetical protein
MVRSPGGGVTWDWTLSGAAVIPAKAGIHDRWCGFLPFGKLRASFSRE